MARWPYPLALLLLLAAALASVTCRLVDAEGRRVDGTCTAVSGADRRTCTTAGGTCALAPLDPGLWTLSARAADGSASPPATVRLDDGADASVVLRLAAPLTGPGTGPVAVRRPAADAAASEAGSAPPADAAAPPDAASPDRSAADAGTASHGADGGTGATAPGEAGGAVVVPDAAGDTLRVVRPADALEASLPVPDRSTGTVLAVEGRVVDGRGRAVDGEVVAEAGGAAVGRAATVAGRFRLYDLPHGEIVLRFRAPAGGATSRTVRVGPAAQTINLALP